MRSSPCPKDLFLRLLTSLGLTSHSKTISEGVDVTSSAADAPDHSALFPLEIDQPTDPGALREHLIDLVHNLRPLLPDGCEWLEEALEVVGGRPVGAGRIADVWVGKVGNRMVALKVFRCYSSSSYRPIYMVSGTYPRGVSLTESVPAEVLQRGNGVQSS
jgi:hypothetical protein